MRKAVGCGAVELGAPVQALGASLGYERLRHSVREKVMGRGQGVVSNRWTGCCIALEVPLGGCLGCGQGGSGQGDCP